MRSLPRIKSSLDVEHALHSNLLGMSQSPSLRMNEMQSQLGSEGRLVASMGFGASPWPVPQCVQKRLIENAHRKYYLPVKGLPELQQSVANVYSKELGLDFSARNVSMSPGTKENLFLLQMACNADLLLPSPSWVTYAPQAQIIGRNVRWIHTTKENGYKMTAEQLYNGVTSSSNHCRILILNSPNNPTGMMYCKEEIEEMASICRRFGVICLSDEIYSPLTFDGLQHHSMASYYPEGTIVLNGLSKWCGAGGYRIGFFLFPDSLSWIQDAMAVIASETFSSCSAPIQYAACAAFDNYYGQEMQQYLHVSRTILNALAFKGHSLFQQIEGCNVNRPNGAFYIFPDFSDVPGIKEQCSSNEALSMKLVRECGVSALGGSTFGRPDEELTLKFSYVDFDGAAILEKADDVPEDVESEEMDCFIKKYCPRSVQGFQSTVDFMKSLS